MSLFENFETSNFAEEHGVWIDFPKNKDGTVPGFLLARMAKTNPRYQAVVEKVGKRLRRLIENDLLTEAQSDPEFKAIFLEVGLLDMRNVQDKDGNVITYDRAAWLMDTLPSLYEVLFAESKKLSNYRAAELTKSAGEH